MLVNLGRMGRQEEPNRWDAPRHCAKSWRTIRYRRISHGWGCYPFFEPFGGEPQPVGKLPFAVDLLPELVVGFHHVRLSDAAVPVQ